MKVNYLNNKDILKEIHKSKTSYCTFSDPSYADFDVIINSLDEIPALLEPYQSESVDASGNKVIETLPAKAKVARAKRLTVAAQDASLAEGIKLKADDVGITHADIKDTDIIFRLMTWDHIPFAAPKQKAESIYEDEDDEVAELVKLPAKYVKVNFPPFQHFKIDDEGNVICVGKSHWKGDLEKGSFSKDHGQMTKKLAHMFIKLCERYATRSNWRGYCVDENTEALTQRGWLAHSEITTSDKILSFDGERMVWSAIKSIFRDNFDGKMFKMTSCGIDALMTPGHKIVTERGLVPIELLKESDKVVLMGNAVRDQESVYSDSMVELIGWIATEGNFQPNKKSITIYQNEGEKAKRIRQTLRNLNFEFSERKSSKSENISFAIKRQHWDEITKIIPDKNLTMEFILSLSNHQKSLLIETMVDANGHRHGLLTRYTQKNKQHMDLFQALLALTGQKMNIHFVHFVENKMSFGKPGSYYVGNIFSRGENVTNVAVIDLHGGKNNGHNRPGEGKITHPNNPTVDYHGTVWCPETEYGCFLARRNGKAYLTGNTYNDEMRSQALLQLSQIGLQFDESKSQNPFAYYTAAITNSFTRVLNIEKRNQNIRDDILEMNGLNPSYTRQGMGFSSFRGDSDD